MKHFEQLWKYIQLTRPLNLIMTGFFLWGLHAWLIVPLLLPYHIDPTTPLSIFWLFFSSLILITAGGYVINAYFDMRIDAINKPDKLIVGISITKQAARRFYLILTLTGTILGFYVSFRAHSTILSIFIFLLIGLLWFYSSTYKRQLIIGNIIVAFVVAIVPLAVATLELAFLSLHYGDLLNFTMIPTKLYAWTGGYALFAFLLTWMREVIKDMEDEPGDREMECRTMPIKWGIQKTKWFLYAFIMITLILLYFVVTKIDFPNDAITMRYFLIGIVLPFGFIVYKLLISKNSHDFHQASSLLKMIMLIGIGYTVVFYFLQATTYQFPFFGLMITPTN